MVKGKKLNKAGKRSSHLKNDFRFCESPSLNEGTDVSYRTEFDRDYGRVLHSPAFRRLQNKTQLFPGQESDFFRNRLTHSLEVSQIARSIAMKLKTEHPALDVFPQVCEIAGLVHDIGHPPFGHNGEQALDACMCTVGGFEGNAQTFRILTRLEKKEIPKDGIFISKEGTDNRVGLNLTARVLASTLKYDHKIEPVREKGAKLEKGYYDTEAPIVAKVKECLGWKKGSFKTIECAIMDLADDIAYSTYDMEDAFKAGFLTPYEMLASSEEIYKQIVEKLKIIGIETTTKDCRTKLLGVFNDIWTPAIESQKSLSLDIPEYEIRTLENFLNFYQQSQKLAADGYWRTKLTSSIVNHFINGVRLEINEENSALSRVYFDEETLLRVNILKHFSYVALINSPRLKVAENRGREIITRMFEKLTAKGEQVLLPEDTKEMYNWRDTEMWHKRVICDFIAGMTDRYAIEFYERLFSENAQTIFKPLD